MNIRENSTWANEVCTFWFEELKPGDWFKKCDALDAKIRDRFASLHARLYRGAPVEFLSSPEVSFAAVILFDQLSRNLFRGGPRSFASDPLALSIAGGMIAKGWDTKIAKDRRVFVYLPFEHSEDIGDQDACVRLIGALGDDELIRYAREHRSVIERFGRFPHRNAVLGRVSTPEEEAYLRQPGSGF